MHLTRPGRSPRPPGWGRLPRLSLGLPRALLTAAFSLVALTGVPAPVEAAPAEDEDWSLEHKASDPTLVSQRFAKLRRSPFDTNQWRALQKAIGADGLAKKIRSALAASPKSIALRILDARVDLAEGKAVAAAQKLEKIEASAGSLAAQVFALRLTALERAGDYGVLIGLLEERSETQRGAARIKLLAKAHDYADRGGRDADALRLAQKLANLQPDDKSSQLRVARAARVAGEAKLADRAYQNAIDTARGAAKFELVAERARARLEADNPAGASELLWSLLDSPKNGSREARAIWWEMLENAHRRDRSTDILIERLGTWVAKNDKEAAAWRALATAQESAGIDPTKAWRTAQALSPRDPEIATALIEALETKGDSKAAVEEFRKMARAGRDVQIGLDLATRLATAGERELAFKLAAEIEAQAGRKAHTLLLLLDFYNLNEEPQKALTIAKRLVAQNSRSAQARIALGEQLYQMNRVKEALQQWAMLPKLVRPPHKGYAAHAQVLSEHGRTTEAVASVKKALSIAPREPSYLRLRAVLAEEMRRPEQALELWEEVRMMATAPADKLLRDEARTRVVELLVGGSVSSRRNKLDGAIEEAEALLGKGEPRDAAIEAGRFLAELHTRRENYSAAVEVQHRLLKLDPADPERLEQLAAAQRRAGQVESALGTLEELLENEPSRSPDVLAEMSELAFEAGDDEKALKTATNAAKKDRTQVEALVRLGELHEGKGEMDAAARAYERALETTPGDVRARLRLAELELTRGNQDRSEELLRAILEGSGPPELMREAGRRALDFAEAGDRLPELLGLAAGRTARHPEADEPREFLLETLDRLDTEQVRVWVDGGKGKDGKAGREQALRAPLVAALNRGSIGARLRAATQLGRLRLPDTAVPLAKMGATLTAPRDSTTTVRAAFERARLSAIRAAGELKDDRAVEVFGQLLEDPAQAGPARQAAAWALARSGSPTAVKALAPYLRPSADPQVAALGCLAVAAQGRDKVDADLELRIKQVAREATHVTVGNACAFASAALTSDANLGGLRDQLRSSDPMLAAVAAWRLGQAEKADAATVEALVLRVIGPGGLARDAASAALARLLGKDRSAARDHESAPSAPRSGAWSTVVERWLHDQVAPDFEPLKPRDLDPHKTAIAAALKRARAGTRAEQSAARRITEACNDDAEGQHICLAPLVKGALRL
jgi:tetratricopeptide (TPR) repeat protein